MTLLRAWEWNARPAFEMIPAFWHDALNCWKFPFKDGALWPIRGRGGAGHQKHSAGFSGSKCSNGTDTLTLQLLADLEWNLCCCGSSAPVLNKMCVYSLLKTWAEKSVTVSFWSPQTNVSILLEHDQPSFFVHLCSVCYSSIMTATVAKFGNKTKHLTYKVKRGRGNTADTRDLFFLEGLK